MAGPAVSGCWFEFSRGIYTAVAVQAILHAEGFTAINILLHAKPRSMTVIAIYTCSRVHAVMKNYMRRKHILVSPWFRRSRLHCGIQSLNSRLFR